MSKGSSLRLLFHSCLLLGGLSSFTFADSMIVNSSNDDNNIVIGKWTITDDCINDYYQFFIKKIVHKTDVDGAVIVDEFANPLYVHRNKTVLVDFRKEHGIGGTKNNKKITISFANNNTAFIAIKKNTLKMSRCP